MHERQMLARAVREEQTRLDVIYQHLDELRALSKARLEAALRESSTTAQAAGEREATATLHRRKLVTLDAVEPDLCFGRLDRTDGRTLHIGRIGLLDSDGEEPVLVDWRAPAARPFYTATAITPEGVHRRRAIRTHRRRVVDVDDELLAAVPDRPGQESGQESGLVGEARLMAALSARRTGHMTDIIRTIQAEQDGVIRAPLGGVLVVQGGPGTGKTAVALHRAAYLLFTHREQLTRRGVLLVGPNRTFLEYISQVLPSLAETGALMRTPGELFPGVEAGAEEPPEIAEIKGRTDMVAVVAAAVADRQEVPPGDLEVDVDGERVRVERAEVARARDRARATGRRHNAARMVFARELVLAVARRIARDIGYDPYGFDALGEDDAPGTDNVLTDDDVLEIAEQVRHEPSVRAAVSRLWPVLTPQRLLTDLWASPRRLAAAAPRLSDSERDLLLRRPADPDRAWTPADVPLLDEAAELLGDDGRAGRVRAAERRARAEEIAYAQGVLDVARGSRSIDIDAGEAVLQIGDLMDAERLAHRHTDADTRTAAERAAADRTWAFGHVIVDEAQDLSPMTWRLLARRCPTRSFTIVGDLAQASMSGPSSWDDALGSAVGDRRRLTELTVGYRTPREVMDLATTLLPRIAPDLAAPRAVRSTGRQPWIRRVASGGMAEALLAAVREEAADPDGGTLGVVLPASAGHGPLADAALAACAGAEDGPGRVSVLTVRQVKGLEFDAVLVVEPAAIVEESRRGLSDLYVALTRPTQRLGIIHSRDLPPGLRAAGA